MNIIDTLVHSHTDLENWNGTDRFHFNAIVADQDLIEVWYTFNILLTKEQETKRPTVSTIIIVLCLVYRLTFQHLEHVWQMEEGLASCAVTMLSMVCQAVPMISFKTKS